MTVPAAEDVAEKLLPLYLPSFQDTGKLYDFRFGKLLSFQLPS